MINILTYCSAGRVNAMIAFSIGMLQVKDWRAGQNKDVGSLEVESFVGGNQQGRQIPFYNDLTVQAVTSQVWVRCILMMFAVLCVQLVWAGQYKSKYQAVVCQQQSALSALLS